MLTQRTNTFDCTERKAKVVAFNKHHFSEKMTTRQIQDSGEEPMGVSENFECPNLLLDDNRRAATNYLVCIGFKMFSYFQIYF